MSFATSPELRAAENQLRARFQGMPFVDEKDSRPFARRFLDEIYATKRAAEKVYSWRCQQDRK